jgi:hypothetical protein
MTMLAAFATKHKILKSYYIIATTSAILVLLLHQELHLVVAAVA